MAKPTLTKLKLKKNIEDNVITINDVEINVKQYLPVEDKIKIITNVLELSAVDNNFVNPVKSDVYFVLELIYNYTNLSFTEKQKEDPSKLYDLLEVNNIIQTICEAIPAQEINKLRFWLELTLAGYDKYRNSAMGIMEQISADYSNLDFDATKIQNEIADPNNLALLKGVMEKLG